jgi:hypothetical protein
MCEGCWLRMTSNGLLILDFPIARVTLKVTPKGQLHAVRSLYVLVGTKFPRRT